MSDGDWHLVRDGELSEHGEPSVELALMVARAENDAALEKARRTKPPLAPMRTRADFDRLVNELADDALERLTEMQEWRGGRIGSRERVQDASRDATHSFLVTLTDVHAWETKRHTVEVDPRQALYAIVKAARLTLPPATFPAPKGEPWARYEVHPLFHAAMAIRAPVEARVHAKLAKTRPSGKKPAGRGWKLSDVTQPGTYRVVKDGADRRVTGPDASKNRWGKVRQIQGVPGLQPGWYYVTSDYETAEPGKGYGWMGPFASERDAVRALLGARVRRKGEKVPKGPKKLPALRDTAEQTLRAEAPMRWRVDVRHSDPDTMRTVFDRYEYYRTKPRAERAMRARMNAGYYVELWDQGPSGAQQAELRKTGRAYETELHAAQL